MATLCFEIYRKVLRKRGKSVKKNSYIKRYNIPEQKSFTYRIFTKLLMNIRFNKKGLSHEDSLFGSLKLKV